jgi:hypothetical protein
MIPAFVWVGGSLVALFLLKRKSIAPVTTPTPTTTRATTSTTPTVASNRQVAFNPQSGPNEAMEILANIKTGIKAGAAAVKGAALLLDILEDAGFSHEAATIIFDGASESAGAFGSSGAAILGESGVATNTTAGQELMAALGPALEAVPYVMAVIQIATIAVSDLQDDQKATAAAGVAVQTAITVAMAAAGATIVAAPVVMGVGFIVQGIMDEMENVPHAVREMLDVRARTVDVANFYRDIDVAAHDWADLKPRLSWWSQARGGQSDDTMTFTTTWNGKLIWNVTRAEAFSDPMKFRVVPQLGVSPEYKLPWEQALTALVRARVMMLAGRYRREPYWQAVYAVYAKRRKVLLRIIEIENTKFQASVTTTQTGYAYTRDGRKLLPNMIAGYDDEGYAIETYDTAIQL